jgi:hypothetical protein
MMPQTSNPSARPEATATTGGTFNGVSRATVFGQGLFLDITR